MLEKRAARAPTFTRQPIRLFNGYTWRKGATFEVQSRVL